MGAYWYGLTHPESKIGTALPQKLKEGTIPNKIRGSSLNGKIKGGADMVSTKYQSTKKGTKKVGAPAQSV